MDRPAHLLLAAAAPLLLVSACTTAPLSSIGSIQVPASLAPHHVEYAILAALADRPPPDTVGPDVEITESVLRTWFGWDYKTDPNRQAGWFLEGRGPGRVVVGRERRRHYLRMAIVYDASWVRFEVLESHNLRQSETRIHERAILWIQELEVEIRRSLGQLFVQPRAL